MLKKFCESYALAARPDRQQLPALLSLSSASYPDPMAKNNTRRSISSISITIVIAALLAFLLAAALAAAFPVSFKVIARGTQETIITEQATAENCSVNPDTGAQSCVNQTVTSERREQKPWTDEKEINDECSISCEYDLPLFTTPEDVEVSEYVLLYDTTQPYTFMFSSTNSAVTAETDDTIKVNVRQQAPEQILLLERVVPKNLSIGVQQVNLLIKNGFVADIKEVSAEITGQGVRTIQAIPILSLPPLEKDYVFVTVNATESGTHDIIIKISAIMPEGKIVVSNIEQFTIEAPQEISGGDSSAEPLNASALSVQLAQYREQFRQYDSEYLDKKARGFIVAEVYDTLKDTKDSLDDAQISLSEKRLNEAQKHLFRAQLGLEDVKIGLQNARRVQKNLADRIKDNALLITAVFAAIAAVVGLIESQRRRIRRLRRRIVFKQNKQNKDGKKPRRNAKAAAKPAKNKPKKDRPKERSKKETEKREE